MFKREYHFQPPSIAEKQRAEEIKYYLLISALIKQTTITNVARYIEALSDVLHCDTLRINTITGYCIRQDPQFVPRFKDACVALYKTGIPMRTIRVLLRSGYSKIYTALDEYVNEAWVISPRLNETYYTVIREFVTKAAELTSTFRRYV